MAANEVAIEPERRPRLAVWGIALPGDLPPYEIRDLPVDILDSLGAPYGMSWADVITDPAARAGLLARIVATVGEITGIDLPLPITGRDAMSALEHLVVLVDDDSNDADSNVVSWLPTEGADNPEG